jgi:hypothetical protein
MQEELKKELASKPLANNAAIPHMLHSCFVAFMGGILQLEAPARNSETSALVASFEEELLLAAPEQSVQLIVKAMNLVRDRMEVLKVLPQPVSKLFFCLFPCAWEVLLCHGLCRTPTLQPRLCAHFSHSVLNSATCLSPGRSVPGA